MRTPSSKTRRRYLAAAAVGLAAIVPLGGQASAAVTGAQLIGYASLPASTFAAGPPSGAAITPNVNNGITSPFASQPVQGFSAIHSNGDGTFVAMPDNGYGAKGNSADFLLRTYTIRPHFNVGTTPLPSPLLGPGSSGGAIDVVSFVQLADPNGLVPFAIVNGSTATRELTGADFDPESIEYVSDGTFWIGEEFGPYLLHFSATGVLLDAPISLPDFSTPSTTDFLQSPQNPNLVGTARVQSSGGFEGMAISPDGLSLYPLLEKPLDNVGSNLLIHKFDLASKTYTGDIYTYALMAPGTNIGDFVMSDATHGLVIERDGTQGVSTGTKKIYQITLPTTPGPVSKAPYVDLMAISNPDNITIPTALAGDVGVGTNLAFPFVTIEDVVIIDANTIGVLNDNNYPFSKGRHLGGAGAADDNEFIILQLTQGPDTVVPEVPMTVVLPISAAFVVAAATLVRRRRGTMLATVTAH
jgi:hypothetical protein